MSLAEVITLYGQNAADIVAMLRQAADSISGETDADNRTVAMVAVQVAENGAIKVYGWGQTDSLRAIGTLHLGAAEVDKNLLAAE